MSHLPIPQRSEQSFWQDELGFHEDAAFMAAACFPEFWERHIRESEATANHHHKRLSHEIKSDAERLARESAESSGRKGYGTDARHPAFWYDQGCDLDEMAQKAVAAAAMFNLQKEANARQDDSNAVTDAIHALLIQGMANTEPTRPVAGTIEQILDELQADESTFDEYDEEELVEYTDPFEEDFDEDFDNTPELTSEDLTTTRPPFNQDAYPRYRIEENTDICDGIEGRTRGTEDDEPSCEEPIAEPEFGGPPAARPTNSSKSRKRTKLLWPFEEDEFGSALRTEPTWFVSVVEFRRSGVV